MPSAKSPVPVCINDASMSLAALVADCCCVHRSARLHCNACDFSTAGKLQYRDHVHAHLCVQGVIVDRNVRTPSIPFQTGSQLTVDTKGLHETHVPISLPLAPSPAVTPAEHPQAGGCPEDTARVEVDDWNDVNSAASGITVSSDDEECCGAVQKASPSAPEQYAVEVDVVDDVGLQDHHRMLILGLAVARRVDVPIGPSPSKKPHIDMNTSVVPVAAVESDLHVEARCVFHCRTERRCC